MNCKGKQILGFKQYLVEAGATFRKTRNRFCSFINDCVEKNGGKPVTVKTKDATIRGVVKADKFGGRQRPDRTYRDVPPIHNQRYNQFIDERHQLARHWPVED